MTRSRLPSLSLCRIMLASLLVGSGGVRALASPPNILFLITDDQTYEAVREFGLVDIETPHLDRLVKEGTTFTHAYNMGAWNGAVCIASRTMLVTGRQLFDAGDYEAQLQDHPEDTWPRWMKAAGYRTYFAGKWHVKAKLTDLFDEVRHPRGGMPQTIGGYNRPVENGFDTWDPADPALHGFWRGGKHWSEVTADDAIESLDAAAQQADPFFMYIAFNAPHDPRQAPQEYLDRYPLERIEVPATFQPEYPYKEEMAAGKRLRDEQLAPFPRTEYAVKVHRREYFAIVTHLDAQIGRILDALEASGQADFTWVFFTADHGLAAGHHGLLGKQNMYDHSLRVPFMVKGPGVPANHRIDEAIYLQDAMATALDLANVERPEPVFFHSLLPQISGEQTTTHYPSVFGSYLDKQRAVIRDGWKLILYPDAKVSRLYHVATDPQEAHDLGGAPDHQQRKRELFAELRAVQEELDDYLDLTAVYPDLL